MNTVLNRAGISIDILRGFPDFGRKPLGVKGLFFQLYCFGARLRQR